LATVVPVTRARAVRNPGKQESLERFNRWLREFAGEAGIPVLDLEAALGAAPDDRFLREEYAAGDGAHLNLRAYAILDRALHTLLRGIEPGHSVSRGSQVSDVRNR
jgi:hypothetical protein